MCIYICIYENIYIYIRIYVCACLLDCATVPGLWNKNPAPSALATAGGRAHGAFHILLIRQTVAESNKDGCAIKDGRAHTTMPEYQRINNFLTK